MPRIQSDPAVSFGGKAVPVSRTRGTAPPDWWSFDRGIFICLPVISGKIPSSANLVVCKINNYTYISHYVILNTPKFTEVFRDGKINTISAFRRRS